jgi:hypothetical protein
MYIKVPGLPSNDHYLTSIDLVNHTSLTAPPSLSIHTFIMKFVIAALFAGIAAAAPTAIPDVHGDPFETVTISNFVYVGVNGYPQIDFHIHSQRVDNVHCAADHIEVDGVYSCDDPSYTFRVLAEQGSRLRLAHVLNG